MRKEVFWAIIAGIVVGLMFAFGAYRIKSNISLNQTPKPVTVNLTPRPALNPLKEFKIIFNQPEDHDVVAQNSVELSGQTKPQSWTVISAEAADYLVKTNDSGEFKQNIELTPGVNQIKVTAFDENASQTSSNLNIIYSSSFVTKESSQNSDNTSPSANIKNKNIKAKAYIGTVTDITDSTLEIKTTTSEIQQVSLSETQAIVNNVGTNNKQVKVSDIAIGDVIVAMGYINNDSVLTAQRILIIDALNPSKLTVSAAKVSGASKKSIDITTLPDNKTDSLTPAKNTDLEVYKDGKLFSIKPTDLDGNSLVYYVQVPDDKGTNNLRTVFAIPQK